MDKHKENIRILEKTKTKTKNQVQIATSYSKYLNENYTKFPKFNLNYPIIHRSK